MALGIVEVYGFVTAIKVADACAKASNVKIIALDKNKPAGGDSAAVPLIMSINMTGDASAVEEAVNKGVQIAQGMDMYVTHYVIARETDAALKMASQNAVGKSKLYKLPL